MLSSAHGYTGTIRTLSEESFAETDPGADVKGGWSCPPTSPSRGRSVVLTGANQNYCLPGTGCACGESSGHSPTAVTSHGASEMGAGLAPRGKPLCRRHPEHYFMIEEEAG